MSYHISCHIVSHHPCFAFLISSRIVSSLWDMYNNIHTDHLNHCLIRVLDYLVTANRPIQTNCKEIFLMFWEFFLCKINLKLPCIKYRTYFSDPNTFNVFVKLQLQFCFCPISFFKTVTNNQCPLLWNSSYGEIRTHLATTQRWL